jgi:hypothetical protein
MSSWPHTSHRMAPRTAFRRSPGSAGVGHASTAALGELSLAGYDTATTRECLRALLPAGRVWRDRGTAFYAPDGWGGGPRWALSGLDAPTRYGWLRISYLGAVWSWADEAWAA